VAARVIHVSDLHIGRREAPEPFSALRELVARLTPEVVLATGDLAHRGKRSQLERAAELLGAVGPTVVAVPGNHDIPYTFPGRFTRTYSEWESVFGRTDPVYESETVFVAGLTSVRPWRQQGGALSAEQLAEVATRLRNAKGGALRIVALHHHLTAPPWRAPRKRPLRRRNHVLENLAVAGAELVASGHVHQASIAERREFEVLDDRHAVSIVLATAPGLGRPRPRRRGEALGVNLYESDGETLTVATFAWNGNGFGEIGRRSFRRG
jgi:3',5'-cyclic AMP phosphodiesterase CpdA